VTLPEYANKFTAQLGQKQVRNNCNELIHKIVSNKSSKLWSLSQDPNQYNNFHNMLDGSLKTTVTTEKINLCLLAGQTEYFRSKDYVIVVHDPSPIRKPEAKKIEHLCLVKDLDNKLVNGLMTYNCVAVDLKSKPIHLLRNIPYSTQQPQYVSQEELRQMGTGKLSFEREKEIKTLGRQGQAFNLQKLTFDAIKEISTEIHKINPKVTVIDVYDRGFDYTQLFEYETSLGNLFIIRSKLNKNSNELIISSDGEEKPVKLRNQTFFNSHEQTYSRVHFKDKMYKNAKGIFEWNYVEINSKTYSVVRVCFWENSGKKIFPEPILLITNMQVDTDQLAMLVFEMYMTRSKIEGVFKFCKSVLGWESMQIQGFECVKNLLSLVFFVAGYFYEIDDQLTKDPTMIWLAELGGGKGKVTRTYILRGLAMLINYRLAQQYIKEHNISEKQIDEIIKTNKSNK